MKLNIFLTMLKFLIRDMCIIVFIFKINFVLFYKYIYIYTSIQSVSYTQPFKIPFLVTLPLRLRFSFLVSGNIGDGS